MRLLPVLFLTICFSLFSSGWIDGSHCRGEEPVGDLLPASPAYSQSARLDSSSDETEASADAWSELIQATILAAVPNESVEKKNWGETAEVLSRYEFKTKKGRLSVRPRTKKVNHGFWQRYTLTLLNPKKTLRIEFRDVERADNGPMTFTMHFTMRARMRTEFEHWVYGVKGLNGQAEADVTFVAVVDCAFDLTSEVQQGDWLPTVTLVPEVRDLHLKVRDIDARQIGIIGGWAAEELGDGSRSMVNSILHQYEAKILKELRRKIVKNQDRFRISPANLWKDASKTPASDPRRSQSKTADDPPTSPNR